MAEQILDLSVPQAASGGSSPLTSSPGASCPIFYPSDLLALQALSQVPPTSGTLPGSSPLPGQCFPQGGLSGYLTDLDDYIRYSILVTNGPKTVNFYGTQTLPNGNLIPFSQIVTGSSSTVASTVTNKAGAGIIQGVGATAVGGIGAATIYVLAELGRVAGGTFTPRLQLFSGLLTGFGIASNVVDTTGGGGGGGTGCQCIGPMTRVFLDTLTGGYVMGKTITPPANKAHRIVNLFGDGLTGPNNSQQLYINVFRATGRSPIYRATAAVIATGTSTEYHAMLETTDFSFTNTIFYTGLPASLYWTDAYTIEIGYTGLNGGNQFFDGLVMYEEVSTA